MNYLFENYPSHMSLDVSTDNSRAIAFYQRIGLEVTNTYLSDIDKIEFVCFESKALTVKQTEAVLYDLSSQLT